MSSGCIVCTLRIRLLIIFSYFLQAQSAIQNWFPTIHNHQQCRSIRTKSRISSLSFFISAELHTTIPKKMNCFNCGHQDVPHIAMYCNDMPQKMLRCTDQRCWAAARNIEEHNRACTLRGAGRPLEPRDPINAINMRFSLTLQNTESEIKRLIPGVQDPKLGPVNVRSQKTLNSNRAAQMLSKFLDRIRCIFEF